jgi:Glycosyl hydrolase family 79 C-terminal beta domain
MCPEILSWRRLSPFTQTSSDLYGSGLKKGSLIPKEGKSMDRMKRLKTWGQSIVLALSVVGCWSNGAQAQAPLPLRSDEVAAASIDTEHPSLTIPHEFSGFSIEYADLKNFTGQRATGTTFNQILSNPGFNPIFTQLLKNLATYKNGWPMVRIGGNSTDESWWNPTLRSRPLGINHDITQNTLDNLAGSTNGSRLILGLNLGQNNPALAKEFAQAALAGLPHGKIHLFELGNEPDIFASHAYYSDPATGPVSVRPVGYSFTNYLREFDTFAAALQGLSQPVSLGGPVFTTSVYGWMQYLPSFLTAQAPRLKAVTYHRYPLSACSWSAPGSSTDPTIANLLADKSAKSIAQGVAPFVTQTQSYGKPLRISEINSVSCGGKAGVSDSFASALWATDVMFNFAQVGVGGVNFHAGTGAAYTPFRFSVRLVRTGAGERWGAVFMPTVNPLYYGILLFNQATANSARLLPVNTTTQGNIKVWATLDAQQVVRVVLLNKDTVLGGKARIQLSSPRPTGVLTRLRAPSVKATSGVTLAGQTFDGTVNGLPLGPHTSEQVMPQNSGSYILDLPPASAALLTLNPL